MHDACRRIALGLEHYGDHSSSKKTATNEELVGNLRFCLHKSVRWLFLWHTWDGGLPREIVSIRFKVIHFQYKSA